MKTPTFPFWQFHLELALGIASSRWKCTARSVGLPQLWGVHSRLKASASIPTRMEPEMPPTLSAINRATSSAPRRIRSEEHTSELQSLRHLICRLLLEKKSTGRACDRPRCRALTELELRHSRFHH